jgi:rhodanese-related sulfurtransferase/DNA-binding transcriptional ArsR family regulator
MNNSTDHREFKDQLYEQFARIAKALANPHRLELIDLLAQGERTVEDLAREAALSIANASQHLQTLRAARLVDVRREGLYAFYYLSDDRVYKLWQVLRSLGETQLAEIDRIVKTFLHDRDGFEAVGTDELISLYRDGNVVLLDVRPEEEYQAGHIPGARSVPVGKLESYLKELPTDKEVIAYCRGPYCVFSDEAVSLLRERGYKARRYERGLPDWRATGLPVDVSPSLS